MTLLDVRATGDHMKRKLQISLGLFIVENIQVHNSKYKTKVQSFSDVLMWKYYYIFNWKKQEKTSLTSKHSVTWTAFGPNLLLLLFISSGIVREMAHKADSKLNSISTTRLSPQHHLWYAPHSLCTPTLSQLLDAVRKWQTSLILFVSALTDVD